MPRIHQFVAVSTARQKIESLFCFIVHSIVHNTTMGNAAVVSSNNNNSNEDKAKRVVSYEGKNADMCIEEYCGADVVYTRIYGGKLRISIRNPITPRFDIRACELLYINDTGNIVLRIKDGKIHPLTIGEFLYLRKNDCKPSHMQYKDEDRYFINIPAHVYEFILVMGYLCKVNAFVDLLPSGVFYTYTADKDTSILSCDYEHDLFMLKDGKLIYLTDDDMEKFADDPYGTLHSIGFMENILFIPSDLMEWIFTTALPRGVIQYQDVFYYSLAQNLQNIRHPFPQKNCAPAQQCFCITEDDDDEIFAPMYIDGKDFIVGIQPDGRVRALTPKEYMTLKEYGFDYDLVDLLVGINNLVAIPIQVYEWVVINGLLGRIHALRNLFPSNVLHSYYRRHSPTPMFISGEGYTLSIVRNGKLRRSFSDFQKSGATCAFDFIQKENWENIALVPTKVIEWLANAKIPELFERKKPNTHLIYRGVSL